MMHVPLRCRHVPGVKVVTFEEGEIKRHSVAGMHTAVTDLVLLSRCDVILRAGKTNSLFTALASGLRLDPLSPVYFSPTRSVAQGRSSHSRAEFRRSGAAVR